MPGAIDFDDEAGFAGVEVGDVASEDDLATEGDAALIAPQGLPEEPLGWGGAWRMARAR